MNVSLTPELEALIAKKVKSGRYHSASEVVRDGLRLLEEQERLRKLKLAVFRREIKKGADALAAGDFVTLETPADFERFGKRTLAAVRKRVARPSRAKK